VGGVVHRLSAKTGDVSGAKIFPIFQFYWFDSRWGCGRISELSKRQLRGNLQKG